MMCVIMCGGFWFHLWYGHYSIALSFDTHHRDGQMYGTASHKPSFALCKSEPPCFMCFCLASWIIVYVANGNIRHAHKILVRFIWNSHSLKMSSLTEKMVLERSKARSLGYVRNLNVWGCRLVDISIVAKLSNLEVLNLR